MILAAAQSKSSPESTFEPTGSIDGGRDSHRIGGGENAVLPFCFFLACRRTRVSVWDYPMSFRETRFSGRKSRSLSAARVNDFLLRTQKG